MGEAFAVEMLKLRRSPVVWTASVVAVLVIPVLGVSFARLADSPGSGPLGLKIDAMVTGTGWAAYLGVLGQLVAVAYLLVVGVVVVWCFGREFSDHTVGSLFALPVSRRRIGLAKFGVVAVWAGTLSVALVAASAVLGIGLSVGEVDGDVAIGLGRLMGLAVLTGLLAAPLALAASVGRGFLAGIGMLLMIVAAAQIAVLFGAGAWFPFAAPGLWTVGWQEPAIEVTTLQMALVPLTALAGGAATVGWWGRFEIV